MIRTEIIAVGTELLMGQIVNSNAAFLSKEMQHTGAFIYHHTVVGDNHDRLKEAIAISENRSDLIILTGGLGPTEDDITKQVLAEHLGRTLVVDAYHLQQIETFFANQQTTMTENNRRQALVIEGAEVLQNDYGFAAGMFLQANDKTYVLLPGPPNEMKPMFLHYATALINQLNDEKIQLESKIMKFFGIGESRLANDLADLIDRQTNPTIATYASDNEVEVRLTASAETKEAAIKLLEQTEAEIEDRCGEFLYGYGETTLADVVIQNLLDEQMTIAAAESLTAGLFQAELGAKTGISAIFKGGMVTYSAEMKANVLQVSKETINNEGVVSEACAKEMAENVRRICDAAVGISFTGVAGPDSLEGNPPGTVWIGLSVSGYETKAFVYHYGRDRNNNRRRAVKQGFQIIKEFLMNKSAQ